MSFHSRQPVIPGEHRETRNPGAKTWIPACAGMTTLLFFRENLSLKEGQAPCLPRKIPLPVLNRL